MNQAHRIVNLVVDVTDGNYLKDKKNDAYSPRVKAAVEELRQRGIRTIFITTAGYKRFYHAHEPRAEGLLDFLCLRTMQPRDDETIFKKVSTGAFDEAPVDDPARPGKFIEPDSQLATYLKELGVKHVMVMGGVDECCAITTAEGAIRNGFSCTMFTDLLYGDDDKMTPSQCVKRISSARRRKALQGLKGRAAARRISQVELAPFAEFSLGPRFPKLDQLVAIKGKVWNRIQQLFSLGM